jgi:hypothetical protein
MAIELQLVMGQFLNGVVDIPRFQQEIDASPDITTSRDFGLGCTLVGSVLSVWFKAALSEDEDTAFLALAAVHTGEPLPPRVPVSQVEFTSTQNVHLDGPSEKDLKPVFVNSPATEGTFTWLSSCSDDLSPTPPNSGRGTGQQAVLSFIEPGEDEVVLQYIEPIELHDGHVSWNGAWDFEDLWSISVRLPATEVIANAGGTGNCNLVDTGQGFSIIVPAAGDGAYDVDLSTAIPVPDGYTEKDTTKVGFWDMDLWTEEVTPRGDMQGQFNFYTVQLEMFFCKNVDCGNPLGVWDLDAYKAEWVSSRWQIVFHVKRVTAGSGKIGGYLMVFRPGAL